MYLLIEACISFLWLLFFLSIFLWVFFCCLFSPHPHIYFSLKFICISCTSMLIHSWFIASYWHSWYQNCKKFSVSVKVETQRYKVSKDCISSAMAFLNFLLVIYINVDIWLIISYVKSCHYYMVCSLWCYNAGILRYLFGIWQKVISYWELSKSLFIILKPFVSHAIQISSEEAAAALKTVSFGTTVVFHLVK